MLVRPKMLRVSMVCLGFCLVPAVAADDRVRLYDPKNRDLATKAADIRRVTVERSEDGWHIDLLMSGPDGDDVTWWLIVGPSENLTTLPPDPPAFSVSISVAGPAPDPCGDRPARVSTMGMGFEATATIAVACTSIGVQDSSSNSPRTNALTPTVLSVSVRLRPTTQHGADELRLRAATTLKDRAGQADTTEEIVIHTRR